MRARTLFRSGMLSYATPHDMHVLTEQLQIQLYLDLRNRERDGIADGIVYDYFSPSPAGRTTEGAEGSRVICNLHPSSAEIAAEASRKASAAKKASALQAGSFGAEAASGVGQVRRERTEQERAAASFLWAWKHQVSLLRNLFLCLRLINISL